MEKGLQDVDHCAEFIDSRSPSSVSGGTTGVHKNLQDLFLVETYSAVSTQTIQLLFESNCGINSKQL